MLQQLEGNVGTIQSTAATHQNPPDGVVLYTAASPWLLQWQHSLWVSAASCCRAWDDCQLGSSHPELHGSAKPVSTGNIYAINLYSLYNSLYLKELSDMPKNIKKWNEEVNLAGTTELGKLTTMVSNIARYLCIADTLLWTFFFINTH